MLRSTDYREIDVDVNDGVVFLSGHVISASNQQRAEAAVRAIPGVLGVKSYLVPDDKIIREVAGGLGKIEHMDGVKFFTGVQKRNSSERKKLGMQYLSLPLANLPSNPKPGGDKMKTA